ncbi:DUF3618 domain-containing protein [Naasia lichenicola]|nr:DUF3618 domain-containing protein [Naasia lichenicola]
MTDDDTALSHKERALGEIRSDIESTREKLAQTLDAIEDKLNVPKQVSKAASKARDAFDDLRKNNPVVLYASAGAALAVIGGAVALRIARR